eukprot:scaffold100775_cov72-Cyclotella_meneghiniana.AAC.1
MDLISQATHKSGRNSSWDLRVSHNSDNTSYAPTGKPHTKMRTTMMNLLRVPYSQLKHCRMNLMCVNEQLEKNFSS